MYIIYGMSNGLLPKPNSNRHTLSSYSLETCIYVAKQKQNFNRKHTHPNFHSCEGGGTKGKEQTEDGIIGKTQHTYMHHYDKTSSNVHLYKAGCGMDDCQICCRLRVAFGSTHSAAALKQ